MAVSHRVRGCHHHRKFYEALAEDLIVFAEHAFRLGRRLSDGASEAAHVGAAARIASKLPGWGGAVSPSIASRPPPFPRPLRYLWVWFEELSLGLAPSFGPPVVTWEALRAWRTEMGVGLLDPWEARLLVHLGHRRAVILSQPAPPKPVAEG